MSDTTTTPPTADPDAGTDEAFGWTAEGDGDGRSGGAEPPSGRAWLVQLQAMIENITEQAGPVLREVSAKAAELAAAAGDKAGPAAARAAEVTAAAGSKLAERSRDLAAELRRDAMGRRDRAETTTTESGTLPTEDGPAA